MVRDYLQKLIINQFIYTVLFSIYHKNKLKTNVNKQKHIFYKKCDIFSYMLHVKAYRKYCKKYLFICTSIIEINVKYLGTTNSNSSSHILKLKHYLSKFGV